MNNHVECAVGKSTRSESVGLLILSGGRATRLQSVLHGRPKSLVSIARGRSVLLDIVSRAENAGLEVCVAVDDQSFLQVSTHLYANSVTPRYSVDSGVGTAVAITNALRMMTARKVLVCNADTLVPVDMVNFVKNVRLHLPVLQVLTPYSVQNQGLIGVSEGSKVGRVAHWGEVSGVSPRSGLAALSSTGTYVLDRDYWLNRVGDAESLEKMIMPQFVSEGIVEAAVIRTSLPSFDFGTSERLHFLGREFGLRTSLLRSSGWNFGHISSGAGSSLVVA